MHHSMRVEAAADSIFRVAAAFRTESVEHMLARYQPHDFPTWQEVHDNFDWDSQPMRDFVEHVKSHGVLRPIPVDYGQEPPQVRNGHTRLLAAHKAGLDRVPVRDHEGFMDPDDPDPWGRQEGGRLLEGHQREAASPTFRIEHSSRGSYTPRWIPGGSGPGPTQHYHSYHAFTPEGEPAGRIDFSTIRYPGEDSEAHVEWIESSHKGAASALMDHLYAEHPDHQIYHGYQTDEGGPFIEHWLASHPEHAHRSHFGEA